MFAAHLELLDEQNFCCEEDVAEEISQMIVKSIIKAGEMLKMRVPLDGSASVGYNWKEVH